MATYTRFEDLDIWQKSRELSKVVYCKTITQPDFDELYEQTRSIDNMLGGFMAYLRKSEIKGLKYKASEPKSEYEPRNFNQGAN